MVTIDIAFPTDEELLIKEARDMISYRANMAGMQFGEEDIVVADEGVAGKIVFLRRTRSHKTVLNVETGEYEYVYDEEGNPVYDYQPLIWLERPPAYLQYMVPSYKCGEVTIPLPKLVMLTPWLICWIKDGKILSGKWGTPSLDALRLSPLDRAREYEGRFEEEDDAET